MRSEPELEHRMNRLENETIAIYELIDRQRSLLSDFRSETRTRFEHIDSRFDRVESTLDEVLRRLPDTV